MSLEKSPILSEGTAKTPQSTYKEHGDFALSDVSSETQLGPEELLQNLQSFENKLLDVTHNLYEEQSSSGYNRVADRYKTEYGIMLSLRGHHEQAAFILATLKLQKWPSINYMVLVHLLHCYLNAQKKQNTLEVALELLRIKGMMTESFETMLWKCIEALATDYYVNTFCCDELLEVKLTLPHSRVKQGETVEASCIVFNTLPCRIVAQKVFALFTGNSYEQEEAILLVENIDIKPGPNEITLKGTVSSKGRLATKKLFLLVNNATFYINTEQYKLNVDDQEKPVRIKHKIPMLLVVNEIQLLAIEIYTRKHIVKCQVKLPDISVFPT